VQRVGEASVSLDGEEVARIGAGLLVLLGIRHGDRPEQADRMARKLRALRIFEDSDGKMNLSVDDIGGEILCVSQFTLYGDASRGNRPGYAAAAPAALAEPLYERFCELAGARRGRFGARMQVELVADGPVTLLLEA
jgi:D-aminoacyl-tRNA deacylase